METQNAKPWWQSKTIWGAFITLIAVVAQVFGYEIDQATQTQLTEIVTTVVAAFGSVLAIYGRITATKRIG